MATWIKDGNRFINLDQVQYFHHYEPDTKKARFMVHLDYDSKWGINKQDDPDTYNQIAAYLQRNLMQE